MTAATLGILILSARSPLRASEQFLEESVALYMRGEILRGMGRSEASIAQYEAARRISDSLRDVQGIIRKRSHDLVVVVDDERRPMGIITHADLRDRDQFTPAGAIMAKRIVTIPSGMPNREAFLRMEEARVKAAPVTGADGRLEGVTIPETAIGFNLPTRWPSGFTFERYVTGVQAMTRAILGLANLECRFTKPVKIDELEAAIESVLGR